MSKIQLMDVKLLCYCTSVAITTETPVTICGDFQFVVQMHCSAHSKSRVLLQYIYCIYCRVDTRL